MNRTYHPLINTIIGGVRLAVYANFWVAGAVWALTLVTEKLIHSEQHSLAVLNGGLTLVYYGFARFFEGPSEQDEASRITNWRQRMPNISWLSMIIGALIALFSAVQIGCSPVFGHYFIAGLISLLYPLPKLLASKGGGLRSVPGLKLLIISAVWAYITAAIPAWFDGQFSWAIFLERLFWTAALTIPFDIRDAELDANSLKTLPHLVGHVNSAFAANALLWTSFAFFSLYFGLPMGPTFGLFLFFATVLLLSNPKLGDLYYSLLIEGFPYLLLAFLWLLPYL